MLLSGMNLRRLILPVQACRFSKLESTDNLDHIPAAMMEEEQREFKERVSQKKRDLMAAERLVTLREQVKYM